MNGIIDSGPLSQRYAHAEQYAQTKTNTDPSPDPNRYRRRCPDPNARIQKFIHYMAIAAICDSGLTPSLQFHSVFAVTGHHRATTDRNGWDCVDVGRFWRGLQFFVGEEMPLPAQETDLKSAARWRYDWRMNAREKFKNLRKWVQVCAHNLGHLERVKEKFDHSLLPHVLHMCTHIKIFCYLVIGCHKNCQVGRGSAKNGRQCHRLCSPKCC